MYKNPIYTVKNVKYNILFGKYFVSIFYIVFLFFFIELYC